MGDRQSKIINFLLAPIKRFPVSFIFLTLTLILPDVSAEANLHWIKGNPLLFNCRLLLCVGVSYLLITLALIISKLSRKAGVFIIIVFHICIIALAFTDIFMYRAFGAHLNVYMLQLVNETNPQEASEFIETYTHSKIFVKTLIKLILFVGSEIALIWLIRHRKQKINKATEKVLMNWCKTILSIFTTLYILLSLCFLVYIRPGFSFDWAANLEESRIWDCGLIKSFVFKVYQAGIQFLDEQSTFERCEKANQNVIASLDSSNSLQFLVIIIGESYNRHHSSLYGYDHETNPRLSKLEHLYIFDDVISPINGTSPVFKSFLSLASTDSSEDWCDAPLFPAIFKHVGYNVSFFSNQFVKRINMTPWDASSGFFNNPKIEPRLFSHRNSQKHKYDEGLLEEFKSQRIEVESDSLNLMFFHLIGQHVDTYQRFPKEREVFRTSDYQRPELTEEQVQEVADYDNATFYNDSIVNEIIKLYCDKDALILYFADHGDEANDFRPHIGRDFNLNDTGAPGLHCQLDVPFLIYLTDRCCALHPDLEQRIAASTHRPFMLDDLPHLLIDISGIQTPWYQPTRSLINENYNIHRQRIINGYSTITPIDYDSTCKAYGDWKIGF